MNIFYVLYITKKSHLISVQNQYYCQVSWCIALWLMMQRSLLQTTLTSPSCVESDLFVCPWIIVLKRWGNSWDGQRCEGRRVHHSAASRSKRDSPMREVSDHFPFLWEGSKHLITIITSFLVLSLWVGFNWVWFFSRWSNLAWEEWPTSTQTKTEDKTNFWTPNIRDVTWHPHLSVDCWRGQMS